MKCLRCGKRLDLLEEDKGYCRDCSDFFVDSGEWPLFDGNPAHLHRILTKTRKVKGGGEEEICVCGVIEEEHEL